MLIQIEEKEFLVRFKSLKNKASVEVFNLTNKTSLDINLKYVVCMIKGQEHYPIYLYGLAKCNLDDTFNIRIGKNIALRKAFEELYNLLQSELDAKYENEGFKIKSNINKAMKVISNFINNKKKIDTDKIIGNLEKENHVLQKEIIELKNKLEFFASNYIQPIKN